MKVIKNLNPFKQNSQSIGFDKRTYFFSFIKHEEFFIFGCGGICQS
jgi:hypothetical protein